jgi:hypothetical protein
VGKEGGKEERKDEGKEGGKEERKREVRRCGCKKGETGEEERSMRW